MNDKDKKRQQKKHNINLMNELEKQNKSLKKIIQNKYKLIKVNHEDITDIVLENKRLINELNREVEQLKTLARIDRLTQLPNPYHFEEQFNRIIAHADRHKHKVALLYLDLDKFKEINDTYGHKIGDKLLKGVAERLFSILRRNDFIARIGGDEFAIIVNEIKDKKTINVIVKKILDHITLPFQINNKITVSIEASIGISIYPKDATTNDQLINLADKAMYRAKKSKNIRYAYHKN